METLDLLTSTWMTFRCIARKNHSTFTHMPSQTTQNVIQKQARGHRSKIHRWCWLANFHHRWCRSATCLCPALATPQSHRMSLVAVSIVNMRTCMCMDLRCELKIIEITFSPFLTNWMKVHQYTKIHTETDNDRKM